MEVTCSRSTERESGVEMAEREVEGGFTHIRSVKCQGVRDIHHCACTLGPLLLSWVIEDHWIMDNSALGFSLCMFEFDVDKLIGILINALFSKQVFILWALSHSCTWISRHGLVARFRSKSKMQFATCKM